MELSGLISLAYHAFKGSLINGYSVTKQTTSPTPAFDGDAQLELVSDVHRPSVHCLTVWSWWRWEVQTETVSFTVNGKTLLGVANIVDHVLAGGARRAKRSSSPIIPTSFSIGSVLDLEINGP